MNTVTFGTPETIREKVREAISIAAPGGGFIFGTAVARNLSAGFVPIRKPGKLPADKLGKEYALEYGTDTLEIHTDAIRPGQQVLMVDLVD